MNLGGLSPDKAPPVEAPLTLFYLLPFFLVLAGVLLASQGDQLLASRWTPAALAATHFLVLGALAPVLARLGGNEGVLAAIAAPLMHATNRSMVIEIEEGWMVSGMVGFQVFLVGVFGE